jgi:hypothetical protein
MNEKPKVDDGSALMKVVNAIAITPEDARAVVESIEAQIKRSEPGLPDEVVLDQVLEAIIARYSKIAAGIGGATALAGVVPGIGTTLAATLGGTSDAALCIKTQIDMSMCLALALTPQLTNEDAKHLSVLIALTCSVEELAEKGATKLGTAALTRLVNRHLQGATLVAVKELFKRFGIEFAKKTLLKVIPFGVGVAVGATANYWFTKFVGRAAISVLRARGSQAEDLQAA